MSVIGNATGKGPEGLEELGFPIVYTDPEGVFRHWQDLVHHLLPLSYLSRR